LGVSRGTLHRRLGDIGHGPSGALAGTLAKMASENSLPSPDARCPATTTSIFEMKLGGSIRLTRHGCCD
jgi:hypothetical protein